jgi:hypothetical protein
MATCGKCGKQKASFQAPVDAGRGTPGHPLQHATNGYKYICPYAGCNVSSFPNAERFRRHLISRHTTARTMHQCFFCVEELTKSNLYHHLYECHPGIIEELQKLLDTGAAGDIAVKYRISHQFIDDQWMFHRQLHKTGCLMSSFLMKDGELETLNRYGKEAVSRQFDDAIHIYNGKQALLTPEELVVKESKLRVAQEAGDKKRQVRQATRERGKAQRRLRRAKENDEEGKQLRERAAAAQRIWQANQPPGHLTAKNAAVRRVARRGWRSRKKKAAELAEEAMPPEERAVAEAARKAVEGKKKLRRNSQQQEWRARKGRLEARGAAMALARETRNNAVNGLIDMEAMLTNAKADTEDESSDSDDDDLDGEIDALLEAEVDDEDEDEDLRADIDALGDEDEDEDWEAMFERLDEVPPPNL